jgi:hypothetical protein
MPAAASVIAIPTAINVGDLSAGGAAATSRNPGWALIDSAAGTDARDTG